MNSSISIKEVILEHYKKYPLMQIDDYIKLIYQSNFGVSHILNRKHYRILKEEYKNNHVDKNDDVEEIGNGFVRVNLAHSRLSARRIYRKMKKSRIKVENHYQFFEDIKVLQQICAQKQINIKLEDLSVYLTDYYKNIGPISHSEIYKNAYSPSYRIMKRSLLKFYIRGKKDD